MTQTAFKRVHPLVARNPVARAVEKANMQKWLRSVQIEMGLLGDGEVAESLIVAITETLAVACKTLDGWEDDGGLIDMMTEALEALAHMANAGMKWNREKFQLVSEATDYACQVLWGMSAIEKQKAWAWAQAIQKQAEPC